MKKIKLMLLIGVLLLPIVVKADSKFIDINKDMFDSTFNVENNYKELALCFGEPKFDNVVCIGQADELSSEGGKFVAEDTDSIDFLNIMYVVKNNVIEYNTVSNLNEFDEELLDKYEKGEFLELYELMENYGDYLAETYMNCGEECRTYEETDGDNLIRKLYKNDILLYDYIANEVDNYTKTIFYYDSGEKMGEYIEEDGKMSEIVYKKNGNIFMSVSVIDDKMSFYVSLGGLNVGENKIEIGIKGEDDTPQIYHVNINREALVEDTKDDNGNENENVIGNDDSNNIKESPNTGSIINLIISIMLIISLITLLYFNRKYNYEK